MGIANRRRVRLSCLLGMALIGFAWQGRAQEFPDGPGKQETAAACGACHGLTQVAVAKHTKQEWDNIVTDMVGRGAAIMETEIPVIVEYLAKSFPKTGGNVNVNRAAAKELEAELKLTPQEAEAIVRHREENGYFNKLQDFSRVQGLDIKKLEGAKDRLLY